ncbi:exonuclease SbcCD subunit D [Christensenellaceae bacterium OttesenSCG-928-L17]|nr:exonuclease SbcCD subunit D [Christensenellaceae bacterium OttesenSCG-928-L17]
MKLLHIADTHIGKRIHGFSLADDQRHALDAVRAIARRERADAVLIAGDLYDKSVPSGASALLLDAFLTGLREDGTEVFLIAGNHDSAERLQFLSRLLAKNGVYISAMFDGTLPTVRLHDAYGPLDITLLPYVSPASVRPYYPAAEIRTHHDAVREILSSTPVDTSVRNILLAHQNVTAYPPGEAETLVGTLDNVHFALFDDYDYVALGHIHQRYSIGRETVRYAGSLHTTSFADAGQPRGVTVIECFEKGDLRLRFEPIVPLHAFRVIRGPMEALLLEGRAHASDDFFHVVLTDEDDVPDAMQRLRAVYPNILHLSYDNHRTRMTDSDTGEADETEEMDLLTQFITFYQQQNGRAPDEESIALLQKHIQQA